jgi:hypothetical protein
MKKHATDAKKAKQYSTPTRKTYTLDPLFIVCFMVTSYYCLLHQLVNSRQQRMSSSNESKQSRTVLQLIPHPNLPGALRRQGMQYPRLVAVQTSASIAPFG